MAGQDRRPYLTATALTQELLDLCHDNLECQIEMVADIEAPDATIIRASDRNKYVGGTFYEALLVFPVVGRTVGEWLSNELQFSTLTLELSNVDGRFNKYLPEGASFASWIGRTVTVRVGLAEAAATYKDIFSGTVTDVGGFKRSTKSITLIVRDKFDKSSKEFPASVLTEASYPKIEDKLVGTRLPVIYGDWTTATEPSPATVPAYVVNGNDPQVAATDRPVTISIGSPGVFTSSNHDLDNDDAVQLATSGSLPSPLSAGLDYWVVNRTANTFQLATTMGGSPINTSGAQSGAHTFKASPTYPLVNVELRISDNDLTLFDDESVYLKRGDTFQVIPSTEIVNVGAGNKTFELKQQSGASWYNDNGTLVDYVFDQGDAFYVKVKGKATDGGYDDNPVWQARDILITYGGLVPGDFASNWTTYRDKASPAQSAIAAIKSRVWLQEPTPAMTFALSLLEQVRLEAFVDKDLKVRINSLHFEDWTSSPAFKVRNWDVESESFETTIDERNVFFRAQGVYNFLPDKGENARSTAVKKNTAAITQTGREISKKVVFPNLYVAGDVDNQLTEILRLSSAQVEVVTANLTWRASLLDIGDFVKFDVKIGSAQFSEVPAMVRSIGFDPDGLKRPVLVWCFTMCPFPGYTPGYVGTVGGYSATIDTET